mmetsp:Transcript_35259/g.99817  ORF Transcript_35259/g.99817 Transcript_35259/m.99817 type:complete len:247 (+) Transcript_35259:300-1040(+)
MVGLEMSLQSTASSKPSPCCCRPPAVAREAFSGMPEAPAPADRHSSRAFSCSPPSSTSRRLMMSRCSFSLASAAKVPWNLARAASSRPGRDSSTARVAGDPGSVLTRISLMRVMSSPWNTVFEDRVRPWMADRSISPPTICCSSGWPSTARPTTARQTVMPRWAASASGQDTEATAISTTAWAAAGIVRIIHSRMLPFTSAPGASTCLGGRACGEKALRCMPARTWTITAASRLSSLIMRSSTTSF